MRRLLLTLIAFLMLAPPAHAEWVWPVSGEVITPYRNGTDPYATGQHRGIDIAAPTGAPVVAAAAGEVRFAGTAGSSGLTVSIRTGDGYDTSYLHLSSLAVRAGTQVGAGHRLGAVGTSGTRSATQPHLHFGVRDAGTRHAYHDPLGFLPPPPTPARSAPPPATAPQPAPAPPAAAPAPVGRSAPAPVGRNAPVPAGRPKLAREPARVHGRAPVGRPVREHAATEPRTGPLGHRPGAVRAPRDLPARRSSSASPTATPSRGTSPAHVPSGHAPPGGSHRTRAPDLRAASSSPAAPNASPQSSPGPDIGWALACAGLLLAAGILGLTNRDARATRRSRRRHPRAVRRARVASMVHAVLRDDAHLLRQR